MAKNDTRYREYVTFEERRNTIQVHLAIQRLKKTGNVSRAAAAEFAKMNIIVINGVGWTLGLDSNQWYYYNSVDRVWVRDEAPQTFFEMIDGLNFDDLR